MTSRSHQRALGVLVVLSVLATACGSTVRPVGPGDLVAGPEADAPAAAPGDPLGGVVPGDPDSTDGSATDAEGAVTDGSGGAPVGRGPVAPVPTEEQGPAPTDPNSAPATSHDSSQPPIKLGFPYLEGATNVTNSLGTEVSFGDGQLQAQALVDDLNARGGINGRPVEAHFAGVNVASSDPEASYNSACTRLTEDIGVFAVLTPINPPESFVACVAQRQTLLLNASFNPGDDGLYAAFGDWFFSPSLLSLDRGAHLMLDVQEAEGALRAAGVKVGIVYVSSDPPNERVVNRVLVPRLKALGVPYELAGVREVPQVTAAQLRFATANVTLVMFVAPNGITQLLFMTAAENQRYRPKYFTTDPDSTRFVSENVPIEQARNIRGVGTLPVANVPVRSYPTTNVEQECFDAIRKGGENNNDRLTNVTATPYCELVRTFAAVAGAVTGELTHDSFRQAYRRLGTNYQPVTTFQIDFSTGRNDNTILYRPYAFDEGCRCLAYTGQSRRVPG